MSKPKRESWRAFLDDVGVEPFGDEGEGSKPPVRLEPATLEGGQTVFDARMCESGVQLCLPFGGTPCLR